VVFGPPSYDDLAFRPLPYVMYGLKPHFTRAGPQTQTSNGDGFRGREIVRPKPPGRLRIVCLGGSTTYGMSLAEDETYPVQLERRLRELLPGRDIEVINAGVESYTTAESLNNLVFRCLDFEPDVVLVYHGINDVRPRRYPDFDAAYTPYRKVWDGSTDDYEKREGELGGINTFIQHPPREGGPGIEENLRAHGPEVFRRNLLSLAGVARAHGILPVFVTPAHAAALCPTDLAGGIVEHDEVIRDLCRDEGIACIDFAAHMSQEPAFWTDDQRRIKDGIHVTPAGAVEQARLIAEELVGLLR